MQGMQLQKLVNLTNAKLCSISDHSKTMLIASDIEAEVAVIATVIGPYSKATCIKTAGGGELAVTFSRVQLNQDQHIVQ